MLQEFAQADAADFTLAAGEGAGVINDPIVRTKFELALSEKNHGVKRQIPLELAEEEQIAGARADKIAAHKVGVQPLQGLRVAELREHAAAEIFGAERAGLDAEEVRAKRRVGIVIFFERSRSGNRGQGEIGGPGAFVFAQCFAIGKTDQRSAIIYFRREAIGRAEGLCFREKSEPAAKGCAIGFAIEAEEVRRTVSEMIGRVETRFEAGVGGQKTRSALLDGYTAGLDADADDGFEQRPVIRKRDDVSATRAFHDDDLNIALRKRAAIERANHKPQS
jgi:hypothetical protein